MLVRLTNHSRKRDQMANAPHPAGSACRPRETIALASAPLC
jgi:hypothetical protein